MALHRVLAAGPHQGSPSSLQRIAQALAERGNLLVTLRTGLGVGIESPDYLATLRHQFLICQADSADVCVVVDPAFREQFLVAGMPADSAYAAACASLPLVFAGTIGTLNALVCLLTQTLIQDATARGLELPPWRSQAALLSKWLPRRFADSVFTPPGLSTLHPALRCSVHSTGPLSDSPNTPLGLWSTSSCDSLASQTLSTSCSSPASTGSSSTTCTSTFSGSSFSHPRTVVRGFAEPSPCCKAASAAAGTKPCAPKAAVQRPASPTPSTPRSALTIELAAASEAARAVQQSASSLWDQCFQSRRQAAAAPAAPQPQPVACQPRCERPVAPCRAAQDASPPSMLQALVVSPVKRFGTSLKRGGGLRVSPATLKTMPRIYTVKLAPSVAAC
ncbi:hypothetical protein HYH03_005631 [Edaphochlamys debaryana]|uniref:Uncharacterized protein n=1 Tax=Edaphochlamys debaryana TaxID=47281 RepID=A0A836C2B1_9CHLO|nr:hypothetical protein HYH03_005631 [Edaphochlamys debaryana]|eukprot:KAG2496404.1 hypothetical protein HYH03_005631 [Edaphochlamys debaryana]